MEAIILAGGKGTRLREVVADVPKPMAPIRERPFLEYVLNHLRQQGIDRVLLSVGYKKEIIEEHFGHSYQGMTVDYVVEETPLGTGGAIWKCLEHTRADTIAVMNGDTFFPVDLQKMLNHHRANQADVTVAVKLMHDFDRYGLVQVDDHRITGFEEKKKQRQGYINGGIYLFSPSLGARISMPDIFSFETDFLEPYVNKLHFAAFASDTYFIDIGLPEDFARAQKELTLS